MPEIFHHPDSKQSYPQRVIAETAVLAEAIDIIVQESLMEDLIEEPISYRRLGQVTAFLIDLELEGNKELVTYWNLYSLDIRSRWSN